MNRVIISKKSSAVRLWQIFLAACRQYIAYFFDRLSSAKKSRKELFAVRLRLFLEELGPTFVKAGQLLSVRPDLVPPEVIFELEKLQESVPPFDFNLVLNQVENELGKPVDQLFTSFERDPKAAGSVAQVHRARLKTGSDVIVKVQRPEAKKIIDADLNLLFSIVSLMKRFKRFEFIDPVATLEEWSGSLNRELDFRIEGRHADRFRFIFKNDELMKIPKIYWELTGKRVLTMEYIDGYRLTDLTSAQKKGIDTFALAEHGARVFIKEVLEDGFFHGDLHPSNILVTPEGTIAYLDFGIVGKIGEREKGVLARLTVAIIEQDIDDVLKQAKLLGVDIGEDRVPSMKKKLRTIIRNYHGKNLGEIKIKNLGRELLAMLYIERIKIPRNFALLAKAMITVEGVAKGLYPEFNIIEVASPLLVELTARNFGAGEIISHLIVREKIAQLPAFISKILNEKTQQ